MHKHPISINFDEHHRLLFLSLSLRCLPILDVISSLALVIAASNEKINVSA